MPGVSRSVGGWTAFYALATVVVAAFVVWTGWLFFSVAALRGNVERNVREMISLEELATTEDEARERVRALRRQNAADSAQLAAKWDQMYAIAVAAVFFATGNVLLVRRLRRHATRLQADADERMELAKKHHETRVASLRTLARGLAHEMNSPLGWITSNLVWLRREAIAGLGDPGRRTEAEDVLDETEQGVARLREIVRGLNTVTTPSTPSNETSDVRSAAELALRFLQQELASAAVEVAAEWKPVPPVKCSPAQIDQIVSALVSNALQSFPAEQAKRRVRLSTGLAESGHVMLEVQDNGPGFSAAARASMFEPFASVDPKRKGLGLYVCKRIAQDCGGDVEVQDAPGGGALVRVLLPAA